MGGGGGIKIWLGGEPFHTRKIVKPTKPSADSLSHRAKGKRTTPGLEGGIQKENGYQSRNLPFCLGDPHPLSVHKSIDRGRTRRGTPVASRTRGKTLSGKKRTRTRGRRACRNLAEVECPIDRTRK